MLVQTRSPRRLKHFSRRVSDLFNLHGGTRYIWPTWFGPHSPLFLKADNEPTLQLIVATYSALMYDITVMLAISSTLTHILVVHSELAWAGKLQRGRFIFPPAQEVSLLPHSIQICHTL